MDEREFSAVDQLTTHAASDTDGKGLSGHF